MPGPGRLQTPVSRGFRPPCRRSAELQATLLILENATFACPENEAHLISPTAAAAPATNGCASLAAEDKVSAAAQQSAGQPAQPFCAWLVEQLPGMYQAVRGGRVPRECLHSALAVLMNVAHNSAAGREVIEAAGAVDAAARLLASVVAPFLWQLGVLLPSRVGVPIQRRFWCYLEPGPGQGSVQVHR